MRGGDGSGCVLLQTSPNHVRGCLLGQRNSDHFGVGIGGRVVNAVEKQQLGDTGGNHLLPGAAQPVDGGGGGRIVGQVGRDEISIASASHSAVSGNVTLRVTPCMVRLSGLRLGYLGVKGRVVRSAISLVSLKVVVVFGPAAAFGTDSAFCVQDTSRMTATFPPSDDDLRPRPSEIPVIRSLRSVPDHGPRQ